MPLLQKPPDPPEQQPAQPVRPSQAALLAQLLNSVPELPVATRPPMERSRRRPADGQYDQLVRLGATIVGLVMCLLAWVTGGYFTLRWLESLGLAWAGMGAGLALAIIPGNGDAAAMLAQQHDRLLAALAWLIPLGISLAEIGFDPWRSRGPASRTLWGLILAVDAATTALGTHLILAGAVGDGALTWGLAALIGLALALVPEKLARRLIRENLR